MIYNRRFDVAIHYLRAVRSFPPASRPARLSRRLALVLVPAAVCVFAVTGCSKSATPSASPTSTGSHSGSSSSSPSSPASSSPAAPATYSLAEGSVASIGSSQNTPLNGYQMVITPIFGGGWQVKVQPGQSQVGNAFQCALTINAGGSATGGTVTAQGEAWTVSQSGAIDIDGIASQPAVLATTASINVTGQTDGQQSTLTFSFVGTN